MAANPLAYKRLSALSCYLEADMLDALPEFQTALDEWPELATEHAGLQVLLDRLERHGLCGLQKDYALVFDRNRRHALYIFGHVYDEDRDHDSAMVNLLGEYHRYGFKLGDDELSDYLPALLKSLLYAPPADMQELLGGAVRAIARATENLQSYGSSYATTSKAAMALSPIAPRPLTESPVHDMDEAMETFGLDWQGIEPLFKPSVQIVRFYPKGQH